MKKWIFVSLAVLAVLGCEKVAPTETPEEKPAATGSHVATLTFGVEEDATRGIFVDDQTFQWQTGDQIGVYLYSETLDNVPGAYQVPGQYGPWIAPFDLTGGAGTGSGVFSRELSDDLGETYGNVAIYPYTKGSSFAYAQGGGTLTFDLPSVYAGLNNLDMVRMPMVAVLDMDGGDKSHFELKHVGGAVKVTLRNVPAKAKYFKLWASEGGNLSGTYTINLNQVGSGTLQGNGSANTVELQLKEGKAAETLTVYFPVPAGTYKLGVGVYGDGIVYLEKQATKSNTIGRGTILRMPELTIPAPNLGPYADYQSPSAKTGGIIYQVNVYSFADSDGDGVGDFKGIEEHLDYLDKLGVTALWLSPSQVAQSYHGYDIKDYTALNPAYASGEQHTSEQAEVDFQHLIASAHQHNIRIYMDYVINHTGDAHPWFQDVKRKGPASEYWNYYTLSTNPQDDVNQGRIPQIPQGWYNGGEWFPALTGAGLSAKRYAIDLDWTNASAPTFKVSETTEAPTSGGTYDNPARYLFWGNGTYTRFADNGTDKYRLVLDYQSDWGCLVRTTNTDDWSNGTKWGFNAMEQIALNTAHTLYTGASDDVKNILMPDGTLYYYFSAFYTGMMPDINYGPHTNCEDSPAFGAIVGTLDKWLDMGLDGLRLDAVKHIYNVDASDPSKNVRFWQQFYSAANAKYAQYASKRQNLAGTADQNIFMVGEVLSGESDCKPYYAGLPALFEFQFWWDLRDALNNDNKGAFVSGLCDRYFRHQEVRGDAIPTPKLTNHDEDRAASVLYERHRIRQAAAVLLTAPGRPIVYQGEELGYWGTGTNGDEYRRAPILWTTDIASAATHGVNDKYDADMLTPSISVATQADDDESLLTLYRRFAYARNTNPALANGRPEYDSKTGDNSVIMGWYMHANDDSGKTCLVLHNISGSTQTIQRWDGDNVSDATILVASDPVRVYNDNGKWVQLPPYSSVVFALN